MHRYFVAALLVGILAVATGPDMSTAQVPEPKADPRICEGIQNQIDHIVSLSNSPTVSDQEKVAKLKEIWSQSWEEIQKFAQDDPDLTGQLKQLRDLIAVLLFEVADPSGAGRKEVSSQAKLALAQVKDRIKPYMAAMKMMCPQLKLPPAFSAE